MDFCWKIQTTLYCNIIAVGAKMYFVIVYFNKLNIKQDKVIVYMYVWNELYHKYKRIKHVNYIKGKYFFWELTYLSFNILIVDSIPFVNCITKGITTISSNNFVLYLCIWIWMYDQ